MPTTDTTIGGIQRRFSLLREYFDLFWTFFKIGAFTFGGGYSMLPLIQKEIVETKKWATSEEIMDCFALSQVAPGVIAVSSAVLIGFRRKGIPGALLTTLGVVLPSFIIISIIAAFLENFADEPAVIHAFAGIRVAVGALILDAVIRLLKGAFVNLPSIAICVIAFIVSIAFNASPILLVLAAGLVGFLLFGRRTVKEARE